MMCLVVVADVADEKPKVEVVDVPEETDEDYEDEEPEQKITTVAAAVLLARRHFVNKTLVEGVATRIRVEIWNIGNKEASNVVVTDPFPPSWKSSFSKQWAVILQNETVSAEFDVKPDVPGKVKIAQLSYTYDGITGKGDVEFDAVVESYRSYIRRTDPHIVQWSIFSAMSLCAVAIPCVLWILAKAASKAKPKEN